MEKIAVLISGEYRKFDVTRKTMSFLDQPNVDVYFSTWDRTTYSLPSVGLQIEETVTKEKILKVLGKHGTIRIDSHDLLPKKKYNVKMIHRWLAGFKLIENSGIKYDYVVILRPDMFFSKNPVPELVNLDKFNNGIGFSWATSMHIGLLPDVLFISTFENMKNLIDNLSIFDWSFNKENNWHKWWYEYVKNKFEIFNIEELSYLTFCRYWANNENNFEKVLEIQHDWRDIKLLDDYHRWGEEHVLKVWPTEIIEAARLKSSMDFYKKYERAVIFDLDGVLVSTDLLHYRALVKSVSEIVGIDITEFAGIHHKSMTSTQDKIKLLQSQYYFSDTDAENILLQKDRYFLEEITTMIVHDNVVGCLEYLKEKNYRLAIASNSRRKNIDNILSATGLKKYFDVIVSAEDVLHRKPAPDILFEVYKQLGINGDNTIYIEDSDEGVEAGLKSKSKVIKINSPLDLTTNLFSGLL